MEVALPMIGMNAHIRFKRSKLCCRAGRKRLSEENEISLMLFLSRFVLNTQYRSKLGYFFFVLLFISKKDEIFTVMEAS